MGGTICASVLYVYCRSKATAHGCECCLTPLYEFYKPSWILSTPLVVNSKSLPLSERSIEALSIAFFNQNLWASCKKLPFGVDSFYLLASLQRLVSQQIHSVKGKVEVNHSSRAIGFVSSKLFILRFLGLKNFFSFHKHSCLLFRMQSGS